MASMLKREYIMNPCNRYVSEYIWAVPDWPLIHDSIKKTGVTSIDFDLNGTLHTCKFGFTSELDQSDWYFVIEFSDTSGIKIMLLEVLFGSIIFLSQREYNEPIPKCPMYRLGGRLTSSHCNYMFTSELHELTVKIHITIVKESDFINCLNPSGVTPMVFGPSNPAPPNIAAELKTMFEKKILSDVTFVLGDETFYAHKVVLAAQSTVFRAMFASSMKEQKNNIIEISDTDAEIFRQFLNYLYSGQVTELEKVVEEMILVADFYDVSHLKIMCENILLESLSENSAIRYLILADKLQCDTLKNLVLHFIRNKTRVLEKAIVEEDTATMMCLKEVLSNNQPKEKAEPIVSELLQ